MDIDEGSLSLSSKCYLSSEPGSTPETSGTWAESWKCHEGIDDYGLPRKLEVMPRQKRLRTAKRFFFNASIALGRLYTSPLLLCTSACSLVQRHAKHFITLVTHLLHVPEAGAR